MRSLTLILLVFSLSAYSQEIRRKPLILSQGGTPEKPAVFDGKGIIIDLGIDITAHDWIKDGDVWSSRGPLKGHPPVGDEQRAGLFIDEVPLRIRRDREAEKKSGVAKESHLCRGQSLATRPGGLGGGWIALFPLAKGQEAGRRTHLPAATGFGEWCRHCVLLHHGAQCDRDACRE